MVLLKVDCHKVGCQGCPTTLIPGAGTALPDSRSWSSRRGSGRSRHNDRVILPTLTLVLGLLMPQPAPPVNVHADYQIGGAYRPAADVGVVLRDRSVRPSGSAYDVCYVNAFQTQPGELDWWQRRHPDLLLRERDGAEVHDPGWPNEVLLDLSSTEQRSRLARIMGRWMRGCARDGFDAIEPDNLDSWTRSGGRLSRADATAYARLLIAQAHRSGLAIAQKNAASLTRDASLRFDFAIAEDCEVYRECGTYMRRYGDHVIEIEYADNGRAAYQRACRARGERISIMLRDRDVTPRGQRGYVYRTC